MRRRAREGDTVREKRQERAGRGKGKELSMRESVRESVRERVRENARMAAVQCEAQRYLRCAGLPSSP